MSENSRFSTTDRISTITVVLRSQPVELYKILKFEGLANSGAEAKQLIDDGLVQVNGEAEFRRRRKIVADDVMEFEGRHYRMAVDEVNREL